MEKQNKNKENFGKIPPIKGRVFLTEYDIKKALTPGDKHLTIAREAIISPLAADWLVLKEIRIRRSDSSGS